jgi:NAD(P)-dependent dehydrogenase (short-subunit alcohol dehydrogenase family)
VADQFERDGQPLAGRVALVTGGGRGIGRAIALALAGAGADVAVTYVRDEASASSCAAEITTLGRRGAAYRSAVESLQDNRAVVDAVVGDFGGLGILISNGGIASRGNLVADTDPAELEQVMRVHALGPHHLAQATLPYLRTARRSDIVFISSIGAHQFVAGAAPYSMGKAAVEALAHTLAREERGNGVHVNIVAPGLTVTDMGTRLVRAIHGTSGLSEHDARSPFGHVCTPEEVAAAVLYLVGPQASYVNDQRLVVDGGTF